MKLGHQSFGFHQIRAKVLTPWPRETLSRAWLCGEQTKMRFECRCSCEAGLSAHQKRKLSTHQAGRHPGIPATEAGLLEEVLAQRKTVRSLQTLWWHEQTANERLYSKQYRDFLFARLFSEVYVCLPLSGYCKNMVAQHASAWRGTSLTLIASPGMFKESDLFDKSMINFVPVKLNQPRLSVNNTCSYTKSQ